MLTLFFQVVARPHICEIVSCFVFDAAFPKETHISNSSRSLDCLGPPGLCPKMWNVFVGMFVLECACWNVCSSTLELALDVWLCELFVSRWDFSVWSFAVFVFLRCVLCLPMVFPVGFQRWVSVFGFCCWAFGGRQRSCAAKICQELLRAARVARAIRFAIVIRFEELRV